MIAYKIFVSARGLWQSAEERGHRGEPSQRTTAVYVSRWWWWRDCGRLPPC